MELAHLRDQFRRQHVLVLPGLIDESLAGELARRVESSSFYRRVHDGIGIEDCMEVNAALAWLLLIVNDERLLDQIRSITGCAAIGRFEGRVYRLAPSTDHFDSWHDDVGDNRLVAMSINLGRVPYVGGTLEIRERQTGEVIRARSEHTGDALLFELGSHLEHRVCPVTGSTARTVFAGWFKRGENLLSVMRLGTAPSNANVQP